MAEFPWEIGVFDAHCHPTDTVSRLQSIEGMRARVLTVMSTRAKDQSLVDDLGTEFGVKTSDMAGQQDWSKQHRVVPAFGWHPWFSYQMFFPEDYAGSHRLTTEDKVSHYRRVLTGKQHDDDFLLLLPDPTPFDVFLQKTEEYLNRHELALIGEVGLDKAFRLPENWMPQELAGRDESLTPGGREGRKLSQYRVDMNHQQRILQAQLRLAAKLGRAASVHGVQAHGILYDTVSELWKGHEVRTASKREKKRAALAGLDHFGVPEGDQETVGETTKQFPLRICLHSYSGPAETVKLYTASTVPCEVFFSFSVTINAWNEDNDGKVEAALRAVPDDRVLMESDLHTAGEDMDKYLEQAARKICAVKGWELDQGVRQLARNWKRFVAGDVIDRVKEHDKQTT